MPSSALRTHTARAVAAGVGSAVKAGTRGCRRLPRVSPAPPGVAGYHQVGGSHRVVRLAAGPRDVHGRGHVWHSESGVASGGHLTRPSGHRHGAFRFARTGGFRDRLRVEPGSYVLRADERSRDDRVRVRRSGHLARHPQHRRQRRRGCVLRPGPDPLPRHHTETDIDVENTSTAGVYIGAEDNPWYTYAASNVTVTGGKIVGANTTTSVDHGAVLVLSAQTSMSPSNITVSNLAISNPRSTASRDIGVVDNGSAPSNVLFSNPTIPGGPSWAYGGNAPQTSYALRSIVQKGKAMADRG